MSRASLDFATHLSVVWGVTLAILTLLEWQGLERDPMRQHILSPFIEREISVNMLEADTPGTVVDGSGFPVSDSSADELQYEVSFSFNGPLFLVFFFLPVLVFHAVQKLVGMTRRGSGPPAA